MYNSSIVAERIKEKAKEQHISIRQLLIDVGLGFNTMSNMKNSMPKADNLARIADHLNCSVDYLLGRENKNSAPSDVDSAPDNVSLQSNITNFLTHHEQTVIEAYRAKPDMQHSVDTLLGVNNEERPVRTMTIAAFGGGLTQHQFTATDEEIREAIDEIDDDDYEPYIP